MHGKAGPILKTLTRDEASGHLRELKDGELAQSVFDEYHSETSRFMFYNDKGEEVQNQAVIDELFYGRSDELEDEILFPEHEMDSEIRTFANGIEFFESAEGMNYIMNRFTKDLQSGDEDSEEEDFDFIPNTARPQLTARRGTSDRDLEEDMNALSLVKSEDDDGYETPDEFKMDNDDDFEFIGTLLSTPGDEVDQRQNMATIDAVRFSQSMRGKDATPEQRETCNEIRDILFNSLSYWRPKELNMQAQFMLYVDREKSHSE